MEIERKNNEWLCRQPTREDILNIVFQMYKKDGLSMEAISRIVDTFPNQGIISGSLYSLV